MSKDLFLIEPLNFPNFILCGNQTYSLVFKATNNGSETGDFQIVFTGDGLEIKDEKKFKNRSIKIEPGNNVNISVDITPLVDGSAKLAIQTMQEKKVSYIDKVKHLRKILLDETIQKALAYSCISNLDNLLVKNVLPKIDFSENDISKKEIALKIKENIDKSIDLITDLDKISEQVPLYYEIIKILYQKDKKKCLSVIHTLIEKAIKAGLTEGIKFSIILIGSIAGPKKAVETIKNIPENLKKGINDELDSYLWEKIEEQKTKIETTVISSIYYNFNSVKDPDQNIEYVVKKGGNISENLLSSNFTSFVGILCLFRFDFSIFHAIEASYSEILNEKGNSFYYLIAPQDNIKDSNFIELKSLLNKILVKNAKKIESKTYIFNLDFIPYLSKPTIIIEDSEENLAIKSIVERSFGNEISFIIDSGLFKGGEMNRILRETLPENKFKILNLVMTYDFLNDYNMLKKFLNEFIK